MNKLVEFGRKALFYVRVLSGYEERKIRNYRLLLEKRLQEAQEKKAALRRLPEQAVLAEVRQMVEQMQSLNQKLEETETAIEEYFKPIDNQAEILMKMQLDGEERKMKQMMQAMKAEALVEKAEAEKNANAHHVETNQHNQEKEASSKQQPL
ncbi:uncharacterized protein [Euphorbia lathyris]|uniref:uncharacterized protein n=1 Tax=Euphorbia lathyris TaxID=212925 RepID=UPI003313A415